MSARGLLVAGALSAFLGVAAGAFGAHGLHGRISPELLEVFDTGVRYQMLHALASPWGGLFRNWEHVTPDADGYPLMGTEPAVALRTGLRALLRSLGILGACLEEAPEFTARRRRAATPTP